MHFDIIKQKRTKGNMFLTKDIYSLLFISLDFVYIVVTRSLLNGLSEKKLYLLYWTLQIPKNQPSKDERDKEVICVL